jgi:hypothetical protein
VSPWSAASATAGTVRRNEPQSALATILRVKGLPFVGGPGHCRKGLYVAPK